MLLEASSFRVRMLPLEQHGIPSLTFAFEEGTHTNVWKSRLEEPGLPSGPWLTRLKEQVRADAAGKIARAAVTFHFSSRDLGREENLWRGFQRAWRETEPA